MLKYKDKITNPIAREIVEWLEVLVIAFILAMVIKTYVVETTQVIGESMEHTLSENQKLLVNRFIYKFGNPKRGDIVVFLPDNSGDKNYIKRIIGLPGEEVNLIDGAVYINGEELEESYIDVPTYNVTNGREFPYVLQEGEYFALGDNRGNSLDSRSPDVGVLTKNKIRGKAICRIYPFSKICGFTRPNYNLTQLEEDNSQNK